MQYFLGIDQGGTATRAAICTGDGTVVGAATGGPSVFYLDDPRNESSQRVRELAEKISADAGLDADCVTAVCGGLTGVDWPHEITIHEKRLSEKLHVTDIIVTNDSIIALRAGTNNANRCIVCAGTGLNIAVHTSDNTEYTYGYFIPDRLQGGLALGQAVIDTVIEAEAGFRPPTLLTGILLSCSGCASVEQFLIACTTRKMIFARQTLVPGLLRSAIAGDDAANSIIDIFTSGISSCLESALTRFFPPGCKVDLVYSGGVFKGSGKIIADAITKTLTADFPKINCINARLEPVAGALLILLDRLYNGNIPVDVMETFERGCDTHGLFRDTAL